MGTAALGALIAICICGCGGDDRSIFVEEHVIKKGSFNGPTIGMMSSEVLSVASTADATVPGSRGADTTTHARPDGESTGART
jgi:hypothetical protein